MLALHDVWENQAFFDALGGDTVHGMLPVARLLMCASKSTCRSNMMRALAAHLLQQTMLRGCSPAATGQVCSLLFVLQRFQAHVGALYAAAMQQLMTQMPYMYTPDMHCCMRESLNAYAVTRYKDARVFHAVLRELESAHESAHTPRVRSLVLHMLCKSVVLVEGKHSILLDFHTQSAEDQDRFCQAVCANMAQVERGSNLEIGLVCTLEAVASLAFSRPVLYTLLHEFSLAVSRHEAFRVQMLHGSLARIFSVVRHAYELQQCVIENDILGHILLLYQTHCTVENEGMHVALCSLLWHLVIVQRRVPEQHFVQMLQIFCTMHHRSNPAGSIMLVVLRLVTDNYKCDFKSSADVRAFVLGVKSVCADSRNTSMLVHGVVLLRCVDEQGMLAESLLPDVAPVLRAFTHAALAQHQHSPSARRERDAGVSECGFLYTRMLRAADKLCFRQITSDVINFLRLALCGNTADTWRTSCRHLELCMRVFRGQCLFDDCAQAAVASLVDILAQFAQNMANSLHEFAGRVVVAFVSTVVAVGARTPLHASENVQSFRALLVKLACQRQSQAVFNRVYRLFIVSCPVHMRIEHLPFKETFVSRIVACRVDRSCTQLQVSCILLMLHTCNGNQCLCTSFTSGICQRVLQWCAWVGLHAQRNQACLYNMLSILGMITRCAACRAHKRGASRQLATDIRSILLHMDASVLHKHNIVLTHLTEL